jgi:hypothetical protein
MAFTKKNSTEKKEYIVKVLAARETKNDAIVMVDIDVNGVKIYSCILKELTVKEDGKKYKKGDKCYVLNLPQEKGSDGKYYDRVWFPRSNDMIDSVVEQVSEMLEG